MLYQEYEDNVVVEYEDKFDDNYMIPRSRWASVLGMVAITSNGVWCCNSEFNWHE